MKKREVKDSTLSLICGICGFVSAGSFLGFVFSTQGVWGWVTWEWMGLSAFIGFVVLGVLSLVFGILSLKKKKMVLTAEIVAVVTAILCCSMISWLTAAGNINSISASLNFYHSTDAMLKDTADIRIAVASDSHYGASSSNAKARHDIMTSIKNDNYDLMIHGGDVVDLGMVKSYYQEAVSDMEEYLGSQKVAFVMGNHDALVNGEENFRRIFQPGETSLNHVLEVAPHVHYVIFNMIWDYSEVKKSDVQWLKDTLSQYDESDCVIVQSHSYYYGTGTRYVMAQWYDIESNIAYLCPIFEEYHVDLVVSGHIHTMQMMKKNNVNYALVGPFGGSLFSDFSKETEADSSFLDGTHYGYTSLHIKEDKTIDIDFHNQDDTVLYNTTVSY